MVTEAPQLHPGVLLADRFEIGELLGAGGMGQVFAAHDRLKDQYIALKVLSPELMANPHARERFLVEARISCDLSHDNIVRVYDVAQSGPHIYFTMERLYGQSLRRMVEQCKQERRPMPLDAAMHIAQQLLTALRYAHGRKVVHRDIKPENIWVCADEAKTVKVMDFGIARALATSDLTRTGMAMGTPYYMAPEQWHSAKDADARADQYSCGVVLYELLTGVLPAGSTQSLERLRRDLPKRHARALMRAMSPKPEQRWPSLTELWQELQPRPLPVALLSGIGAAVVVAVIAAANWPRSQQPTKPAESAIALSNPPAALTEAADLLAAPTSTQKVPELPTSERTAAKQKKQPEPVLVSPRPAAAEPARAQTVVSKLPTSEPVPKQEQPQTARIAANPPPPDTAAGATTCMLPVGSTTALLEATTPAGFAAGKAKPLSGFRDRLSDGSCGPVMVVIPAGELLMGSPFTESGRNADEGPQHRVTLQSFALAQSEATFDDYDRFARATGRKLPSSRGEGRGAHPVINVSWRDAMDYAQWLSEQTGERYALPSEAEWEYAARAATTTPFSTGDCIATNQANYDGTFSYPGCRKLDGFLGKTQLPGSYPANPFKLHHMSGNVGEWMQDCYHASYDGAPTDGRAWVEQECTYRVVRGGSLIDSPRLVRSASRGRGNDAISITGFRLARAL